MNKLYFPYALWCDGMIAESDGKFAVIDTMFPGCADRITASLYRRGAEKLEFVIISHYHNDHFGGCIDLIKEFPTDKVYVKGYSGKDSTDGDGNPFTDEGRAKAWEEYNAFLDEVRKYSTLVMIDTEIGDLRMGEMTFRIYNADSMIERLFTDPAGNEYMGKFMFNENTNSIAVYLECDNGASAFIAADCLDSDLSYEPARFAMTRAAESIGHKIDVYKVSHHGCGVHTSEAAAAILRPDYVITTNAYTDETTANRIKAVNPEAKFLYCKIPVHEFTLEGAGKVIHEEIV